MGKRPLVIFLIGFFLAGCGKSATAVSTEPAVVPPTATLVPTSTPTATSTSVPTPVETAIPFGKERTRILEIMSGYGVVDWGKLSDSYWNTIGGQIERYGVARRILALELHGDNYYMYNGGYAMTPEAFESQMRWLLEHDYHFVTGPELVGHVEGWLELPARSVILTTDSGNTSMGSLPRMIQLSHQLEEEFGFAPHFLSFIWTNRMGNDESTQCVNDRCWDTFREALESGYFSFGTHTESHADFGEMTYKAGLEDLLQSRREIQENLGVVVYGIAWPFERCPEWMDRLPESGFVFAFGGWSRGLAQCYTYKEDNLAMCLPRLFPPNPDGTSGRPNGRTLVEMLGDAEESYQELPAP